MNSKLKYLVPGRCIIFILIYILMSQITKEPVEHFSKYWSLVATGVNIFIIFFLIIVTKKNGSSYGQLIHYRKGSTAKEIVGTVVLIVVVGMAGMYLSGLICYGKLPYMPTMMIEPIALPLACINLILLPATTAFAEEGVYLGCGVNQIKNRYLAVVIPAFFFALQHSFIPVLWDGTYMSYRFLSFLPLTIILCVIYYKKRNPLPIMIGHAVIDLATAVQILATSAVPGLYEKMIIG